MVRVLSDALTAADSQRATLLGLWTCQLPLTASTTPCSCCTCSTALVLSTPFLGGLRSLSPAEPCRYHSTVICLQLSQSCMAFCRGLFSDPCSLSCERNGLRRQKRRIARATVTWPSAEVAARLSLLPNCSFMCQSFDSRIFELGDCFMAQSSPG